MRGAQIISVGLLIGLLLGSGVMGFMGLTRAGNAPAPGGVVPSGPAGSPPASSDPFVWLVIATGVCGLVLVMLLPGLLAKQARKLWEARADDEMAMRRVYQGFMSVSILQAALLEGPGLLGAVATMLTGNALLLLAPGLAVVFLAALFPRRSRFDRWVEEVTGESAAAQL
jgi:hypothetical protein